MKITEVAIDRRITVFVLLFIIVLTGVYSYVTLPRESEPEIVVPYAFITVTYQGVAPADMETLVTVPIEKKLTGISGVAEMRSISAEGVSTIIVEFEPEVDIDASIQKVRDKVDMAESDLPEDADDPIIQDMNMAEAPVVFVDLTGPVSLGDLTDQAEELQDRLETLSGVMEVQVLGKAEREIQIVLDPTRVGGYGIPLSELIQIAQVENVNTPAGSMDVGEAKYLMRVPGEISSAQELQDLVVKRSEEGVVYLRDLAVIRDGYKEAESFARLGGEPSVTLVVKKRAGINIIELAREIRGTVATYETTAPAQINFAVTLDESTRIEEMVRELEDSIYSGLILVCAVIFMYLGFANAVFVALAIPLSLLVTFAVMNFTGMTLNMVTLFSLMIALGMLVDNGIVVVENIYRHAQEGRTKIEAAKAGTAEVAWPVFGSTLTTVAAFFPLVFWTGMMGRFLRLIPITVIITLFASLFVGLIVNPALASAFVNAKHARGNVEKHRRHPFLFAYEKLLTTAIHYRAATITLAVTLLVVIIATYFQHPRFVFLTEVEPDRAYVNFELAGGSNLESTDKIARAVEDLIAPELAGLEFVQTNVGAKGAAVREGSSLDTVSEKYSSHQGRISLVFPHHTEWEEKPSEIVRRVRGQLREILGADFRLTESGMGPGAGLPVNIELSGEEFDELSDIAIDIRDRIQDVPGLVDLEDDLERGKPEVRVVVDRQKAALAGLNTQYIGLVVQAAIHGRQAGEYREGDEEYDVTIMYPDIFRDDLSNVESMSITNANGNQIPFSSVARLEHGAGLGAITRIDQKRTVTIRADADGRDGPEVLGDVQAALSDLALPPGYSINYTGENEEAEESSAFMSRALFAGMCLIALVLITQFNSIIQPAIIMSSVILSFGGVFFGLLVFDMPFVGLMTGIGCIILAGIVVNNAIVLVDFINRLRQDGMGLEKAIVTAGRTRLRPVLLTAVTTILGLTPLGFGVRFDFRELQMATGGSQSEYWGAMAIAIIFGLTFATILTLVVVPVLYSVTVDVGNLFRRSDAPRKVRQDPELFAK